MRATRSWPGATTRGLNKYPAGLCGTGFDDEKFQNILVRPENHRFASYADVLESFP